MTSFASGYLEDSLGLRGECIGQYLDSFVVEPICACNEVLLFKLWEVRFITQAPSVHGLLSISGHMVSMTEWNNDVLVTRLLAWCHHLGITFLVASVLAECIVFLYHYSKTFVKVS